MAFDIEGAKKAGYSDAEIAAHLAQSSKFDLGAAKKAGYSDAEVIAHLQDPGESIAMRAGRELPGAVRGLASVMQGPTFGFSDELAGLVGGAYRTMTQDGPKLSDLVTGKKPKTFSENYAEVRDMTRGAAKQESEDSPWFSTLTKLAASAPTMLLNPLRAAMAPASVAGRAGMAAGQGGIFGALSGAGESTAQDAAGVALDTAKGGGAGAALGGVTSPAADMLGAFGRRGMAAVSSASAESFARQKVAEALARDAAPGVSPAGALGTAGARLGSLGPEGRVIDAGGQNTRQLADTLATLPGRTKQAVEEAIRQRQAGRARRMTGAAEAGLNPNGDRLAETVDSLIRTRSQQAVPLYESLYKRGVFIDDELRGMISAAEQLGAGGAAKKIATAKEIDYALGPETKWSGMRNLDYLKQGLDDIVAANTDQLGRVNKVGASVLGLKHDYIRKLDELTGGAYKQARDAFSGPSALIDAANAGRKALALDDMSIAKAVGALSTSEQEAFRVGAAEALRAKLGTRSGQTQVMELWREKGMQEKLKAIFGDERSFREFASEVAKERRMKGLESVGRGSQTAARQYGAGDLDLSAVAGAAGAAGNLAHGNVPGALAGIASAWNRVNTPEPVRDRMGAILLGQGQRGQLNLQELDRSLQDVMNARIRNAGAYGVGAGMGAPSLANALMAPVPSAANPSPGRLAEELRRQGR